MFVIRACSHVGNSTDAVVQRGRSMSSRVKNPNASPLEIRIHWVTCQSPYAAEDHLSDDTRSSRRSRIARQSRLRSTVQTRIRWPWTS